MQGRVGTGPEGFRVIGALKFANAILLALAGIGAFRLLNRNLGDALEGFVDRLHLDPDNEIVHATMGQIARLDRSHLQAIGAGSFFYAALEAVEGIGLLLRRRWAGYLTIVATALLLIPEGFELARRATPLRLAVLAVNLAILVYLIAKVRAERRQDRASSTPS